VYLLRYKFSYLFPFLLENFLAMLVNDLYDFAILIPKVLELKASVYQSRNFLQFLKKQDKEVGLHCMIKGKYSEDILFRNIFFLIFIKEAGNNSKLDRLAQ
jgi:hypothetical protein